MPIEFAASAEPALHITDVADLVAAVPYLLGFRPTESIVLVALRAHEVAVTIRVDLTAATSGDGGCAAIDDAVVAAVRSGADAFVGVVFSDRPVRRERMPHRSVVEALGAAAAEVGRPLLDVFVVRRSRWWSFVCVDSGCVACTDEGDAVDELSSPVAAAATYAGLVALPTRDDVVALLEPLPTRDRLDPLIAEHENAAMQAALDGHGQRDQRAAKRAIFAAARAADGGRVAVSDERAARFAVALSSPAVRDPVWLAVDGGRLDGRELWRDLARRVPSPYDAAPLFLTGWAAWRSGNGVLAGIAAERALASDPSYSAADLLLGALAQAVNPFSMPRLRAPRTA